MATPDKHTLEQNVVPLFGRDEMNLAEFPYGPIGTGDTNTLDVTHVVWDRTKKREVTRRLIITGSEAFGLPRPVDDRVLIGLKALTYEANFTSPKVFFSRHHLCHTLGWNPDGRAYKRIEDSLDRIAGTTLKFKNSWWDKGDSEWRSHTFHLVDNVELCSHDRYQKVRSQTRQTDQRLSYFVWNEVIWKSFSDGFMKKIDMQMFRRIANGKRRDVAVRLYRVLDKRFYHRRMQTFDVRKLCSEILGLNASYVSKMTPSLERAGRVLVDCDYLKSFRFREGANGILEVVFVKKTKAESSKSANVGDRHVTGTPEHQSESELDLWLSSCTDLELESAENALLDQGFGDLFEVQSIRKQRAAGLSIRDSGFVRKGVVKRFMESHGVTSKTA